MANLIDLDTLADRVAMSVRNIRFYTSRGLVPPPIRQGRQGWYDAAHVERLQLIRELQDRGFTLAAIDRYLADTPATQPVPSTSLSGLGLPPEVTRQAAAIFQRHGRSLADDLMELFRTEVVPAYNAEGQDEGALDALVERLRPISVAALISAYESALAERRHAARTLDPDQGSELG